MSFNSVKKIIRSTYYYGTYRENQNFCEPYITKEQWDKLQMKKPVIRTEGKKTEVLFSGMIRCPHCNHLMRSCQKRHRNGKVHRYFHCEYHSVRTCDYAKVKSELLIEKMLIAKIDEYMKNFEITLKEVGVQNKKIEDKTKKYQQELDRLNTMFLKGRIDEAFYDAEYLRLNDLIAQNKALTQAQEHSKPLQEVFFGNWKEMYFSLDKLHKKLFWRDMIKQIIVDDSMNVVDVIFL
jgi:hypothetical protein